MPTATLVDLKQRCMHALAGYLSSVANSHCAASTAAAAAVTLHARPAAVPLQARMRPPLSCRKLPWKVSWTCADAQASFMLSTSHATAGWSAGMLQTAGPLHCNLPDSAAFDNHATLLAVQPCPCLAGFSKHPDLLCGTHNTSVALHKAVICSRAAQLVGMKC